MNPILVAGELWRVVAVDPDDPGLIDGSGIMRVATADPAYRIIRVSRVLGPPLLDKVLLHEIAHAITVSHGLPFEGPYAEAAARLIEDHAMEALELTSRALGRPFCMSGHCIQAI